MTTPGMKLRIPSRSLILILLAAVLWFFYNASVNRHVHILSDGYAISHAHPFADKQANPGQSEETSHRHSKKELMLLSLFNGLIYSFIIVLILSPFLHTFPQFLSSGPGHQKTVRNYYQVHHYHAPPLSA